MSHVVNATSSFPIYNHFLISTFNPKLVQQTWIIFVLVQELRQSDNITQTYQGSRRGRPIQLSSFTDMCVGSYSSCNPELAQ